jgi:hypothetical protein
MKENGIIPTGILCQFIRKLNCVWFNCHTGNNFAKKQNRFYKQMLTIVKFKFSYFISEDRVIQRFFDLGHSY